MNLLIIDYGMGNICSIVNAIKHVSDINVAVSNNYKDIMKADCFILPGVGAFRDAIHNLEEQNYIDSLKKEINDNKKPILGICLGMQLLFSKSFEGGEHKGLNFIDGEVVLMEPGKGYRIPHVGWNNLKIKENSMFSGLDSSIDLDFYFVHSYYANTSDQYITSTFEYGKEFTASVRKNNIWGTQFHPEKSQKNGMHLLRNFISFCKENSRC